MAKKNNKYKKKLTEQAYCKLKDMLALGESRNAAKTDGTAADKIFSIETFTTYKKHVGYFCDWIKKNHPEVTTLKKCRKYVPDWLEELTEKGYSAFTIASYRSAVNKLFQIQPAEKEFFNAPERRRADIKRSRGSVKQDHHFSEKNNAEIIAFGKGTGLRKNKELKALKGGDLITKKELFALRGELVAFAHPENGNDKLIKVIDDALLFSDVNFFIFVRHGKGGKARFAPIIGKESDKIVERMKATPVGQPVWIHIPKNLDEHALRADYCLHIYRHYARAIDCIPFDKKNKGTGMYYQSDVYVCRKDEAGKKLDKKAMKLCSLALGHNRISVVAQNYLYGL